MSSRYRVEYHLKAHRKDAFIQWIKGLLAVPFVLHSVNERDNAQEKYRRVFEDVERLVEEKIEADSDESLLHGAGVSRLDRLVPTIGTFFTPLPLTEAFLREDARRAISERAHVSPSFNDIRHVLNTAQILQLARTGELALVTFDGDVTLYEDGASLAAEDKVIARLLRLLGAGMHVGIVTAAGYDDAENYERRLFGLLRRLERADLPIEAKRRLCVMGGESNFLFRCYERDGRAGFERVPESAWMSAELQAWSQDDINATLDLAEVMLRSLREKLRLPAETQIIRKVRAVGIVPGQRFDPELGREVRVPLLRETLEEIVLAVQSRLETFPPAQRVQFSCFDGGSDVWCDIGGKDLGVAFLQRFYSPESPIRPNQSLHVGDQFAPVGSANDVKARLAGCTAWISSPQETVALLDDLLAELDAPTNM
ncbi:AaceriAAR112Cp [[Ashbya] aceris (nom. inval.)]|nr:AaceriAAR112Cp [[Ashbya] aceris (nom. inval.)]